MRRLHYISAPEAFSYGSKRSKLDEGVFRAPSIQQALPASTPQFSVVSVAEMKSVLQAAHVASVIEATPVIVNKAQARIAPSNTPSAVQGPSPTINTKEAMSEIMSMFGQ